MARHEVIIHQNTGATAENAPYLGSYIAKETVPQETFVESVAAKCGLPAIQVATIIDGAFEAFEELESAGLVRVHTDLGVVCGVISGSFPTSDAAFDPERNALELALRLDDSIRLSLSDVTPKIVTDETVTKLRVDNVMDIEEERPMNLIHGQHVFRVAGLNIVLGDEGAAIFLQDKNGTTFAVIVDEVISKQLIKAHTAELLPAGDYKLVVKSRAGDVAGPLQTASRRVKYLRVEDPVTTRVDNVTNSSIPGDDTIASMSTLTIVGAGLALGESDEVTVDCMCEGESHHVVFGADAADENTDTRLVLDPEKATGDDLMCDSGTDATVTVKGVAHAVTVGGE